MNRNFLRVFFVFGALLGITFFTGCNKDNVSTSDEVENFTAGAIFDLQERSGCGQGGCFELVFPVTLIFSDDLIAEVNTYEEMRTAISEWKAANPGVRAKPDFVFPIEVINQDGEVVTVGSHDELHALRLQCGRPFGRHPHHGKGKPCFRLVFPVNITLPDGTTTEAADPQALKAVARAWREDNPGDMGHPELVFPVTVTLEDGTSVTVNSKEELIALKDTCSGS